MFNKKNILNNNLLNKYNKGQAIIKDNNPIQKNLPNERNERNEINKNRLNKPNIPRERKNFNEPIQQIKKNEEDKEEDEEDDCIDLKCIIKNKPSIKIVREFFQHQAKKINDKSDEFLLMKKFNINL